MKEIFGEFSKHFNSRVHSLSFVKLVQRMKPGYDPTLPSMMVLLVEDAEIFQHLVNSGYLELLNFLVLGTKVEKECYDVYASEVEGKELSLIQSILENGSRKSKISLDLSQRRIAIEAMDAYIDLTMSVFSELHSEIVNTTRYFSRYHKLYKETGANLFLNANASTAFSYFVQMWVFSSFDFPRVHQTGVLVS